MLYPIGLMLIVAFWWLANKIKGWDKDLVNLLTFLSVEASIATSLVQRDQAKQEEMIMKMLKYIKHTLEALRADKNVRCSSDKSSSEPSGSGSVGSGTVERELGPLPGSGEQG